MVATAEASASVYDLRTGVLLDVMHGERKQDRKPGARRRGHSKVRYVLYNVVLKQG